jgi:hypothetical protein
LIGSRVQGWAFDPGRPHAALSALGATTGEARALQPIVQMAVTAATEREVLE